MGIPYASDIAGQEGLGNANGSQLPKLPLIQGVQLKSGPYLVFTKI